MDIKEAFRYIRKDIEYLNQENTFINSDIEDIKYQLKEICGILEDLSLKIHTFSNNQSNLVNNHLLDNQTDRQTISTKQTDIQTQNTYFKPLNAQYLPISTGNDGVSTDRQTIRQTDNQTDFQLKNPLKSASELIDSLDNLKKEIRLKFKRLTDQEILVFSALYQLDEEIGFADYKTLSQKTNLTESSIRDYIRRLIGKGIPLIKNKINNKSVQLLISPDLKKMATLSTIISLREL